MSDEQRAPFRFGLRGMLIAVAIVGVICFGIHIVRQTLEAPRDAYATWDGANLVIAHLQNHDGQWPKGWDDIDAALRQGQAHIRGGATIESLKERLVIDFNVEAEKFAAASPTSPQGLPKVIRLCNGRSTYWAGAEPNALIHQYLNNPKAYFQSGNY